jgi:hypothetical protein
MWRLHRVESNASWLYRLEDTTAIVSCRQTPEPNPAFIRSFRLRIVWMVVLPLRVGLPDFQHCVVDWRTIAIQHAKHDPCTLSLCVPASNASNTMLIGCQLDLEKRTDRL